MPKDIFISHSSIDKPIIDKFIDLILDNGLSIDIGKIFCTSTEGAKIKSGQIWRESIKENLTNAKVVILIITSNYKESEVCLYEMGASWVLHDTVLPIIIAPISNTSAGIIIDIRQIENLKEETSLDKIRDVLQKVLSIDSRKILSDRWTIKKKEFLRFLTKYLDANPFTVPISRTEFEKNRLRVSELNIAVETLLQEKSKLETYISALKKTKDKSEVAKIDKDFNYSNQYDEFKELCEEAYKCLNHMHNRIIGIIYKTYTNKDITIEIEDYRSIYDDALARDYIDQDLDAKWHDTEKMNCIHTALEKLRRFLEKELDDQFNDFYYAEHSAPLDINNLNFWEEVLEVSIIFS